MKRISYLRAGIIGMLIWLGIGGVLLLIYSIYLQKYDITVGSFAVIASTISAIFAYELIHKDKVNQLALVIAEFDNMSRYKFFQLAIKNVGGSTAFNVKIEWLEKSADGKFSYSIPKNFLGNPIGFHTENQFNRVLALQKGSTHYILVNDFSSFFKENKPACFLARITYEDLLINGELYSHDIPISMEEEKMTTSPIKESLLAEFHIQKIPKKLKKITEQLEALNRKIGSIDN